jgi:uncharacterized protein (DUF1800 family)
VTTKLGAGQPTDQDRASIAHLLRRAGFGASGAEIDAAAGAGYAATVRTLLSPAGADPGVAATPEPSFPAPGKRMRHGKHVNAAGIKAANKQDAAEGQQLIEWWLDRMASVRQPWVEKRTFFWHTHFATSIQKVRYAAYMLRQNQTERTLGGGTFAALVHAMVRDPAMMIWLDASGNTATAPNENLARELMELFTLGVGNYTENDVRAAARALTGWRLDADGQSTFVAARHAPGPETVLGHTGDYDADTLVDLILAQPASPRYVVTRMWNRFAAPGVVPADAMDRLLAAYGSGGDLGALQAALFTDPEFVGPACRYALVKQPVEYVVGVLRALRVPPLAHSDQHARRAVRTALRGLGQLPFTPPNVGGWPAGNAWLTTAAAQSRINFATWAVKAGDIGAVRDAAPSGRIDACANLLGIDDLSARTRDALSDVVASPTQLVALALLAPEYLVA